jgi:CheY-like chemotaxis protein
MASEITILVVEDEWVVRHSISDFLRRAGCRVVDARSGEEAVSILQQTEGIDAVVTDLRLGGALDGWDVGEAARKADPERAVIYISGDTDAPGRPVPGSLFIRKPYDPEEVLGTCRALCEGV